MRLNACSDWRIDFSAKAPRMIDKATLSPAKRALLEKRLGRKLAPDSKPEAIARRSDGGRAPVTFEQERVLSIARSEGRFTYYSNAFHLRGPLDATALEGALSELVKRHETLRTAFETLDGELTQIIRPARPVRLPLVDVAELQEEKRGEEAIKIARRVAGDPFDLKEGSLYRVALLRSGEEDHFLLFTILHIIADRQSMGILFNELITLYDAFSNRRPSPLAALSIHYGDYAQWQREQMTAGLERDLSFWKEELDGCKTVLRLPASYARPEYLTYRGKFQFMQVSDDLVESLRALSRREGVTLFMTMFAAFNILLHGYTGEEDILVGVPLAKRDRTELEGLIGCFTNTLVIRTRLDGDPEFRGLLRQVRDFYLAAYSHKNLPFEKLLRELQPAEEPGYLPLVQVGFGFQNSKANDVTIPGLRVSTTVINTDRAVLDLMMRVEEVVGNLYVSLQYKTDLFSEEMASSMLTHYRNLLWSVSDNSDARVSQLAPMRFSSLS